MAHTHKAEKHQLLQEITSKEYRCSIGGCPAVFSTDDEKLVIIGKQPTSKISEEIKNRIAKDEQVIVVDKKMILDSLKL